MVTKERLQELINQGATIYEVKYGKVNTVSLKNKIQFVSEKYPVIAFEPRPNEKYKHHKYFDKLYETQSEAEWVAKMHAQRTEYFEPPTFEEVTSFFNDKHNQVYKFEFIDTNHKKHTIRITRQYIYKDEEIGNFICSEVTGVPATKENYIKACEYARNLFLGKENDNE